jgi:hypothetical protein
MSPSINSNLLYDFNMLRLEMKPLVILSSTLTLAALFFNRYSAIWLPIKPAPPVMRNVEELKSLL